MGVPRSTTDNLVVTVFRYRARSTIRQKGEDDCELA